MNKISNHDAEHEMHIDSFNGGLGIDLDDIEVDQLDQRLEMTLVALFGGMTMEALPACDQFSCIGYAP